MAHEAIRSIERTMHRTYEWINDLQDELGWDDRQQTYSILKATLQTMRDRLPVEQATDFGAQLPTLLRGAYFEGYTPTGKPVKMDRTTFINRIHAQMNYDPYFDPEVAVRKVLGVIREHLGDEGEMEDIKANMPKDLEEFYA